jgi:hypothetical protein
MSSLELNFGDETYVHLGSSNDELAPQLEELGLNKAGLPKDMANGDSTIIYGGCVTGNPSVHQPPKTESGHRIYETCSEF